MSPAQELQDPKEMHPPELRSKIGKPFWLEGKLTRVNLWEGFAVCDVPKNESSLREVLKICG